MPTPAEQKALAFVAFVILVGVAARLLHSGGATHPPSGDSRALDAQVAAVDSAAGSRGRKKGGKRAAIGKVAQVAHDAGAKVTPTGGIIADPADSARWYHSTPGFPPPSPRIDVDSRQLPAPAVAASAGQRTAGRTSASAPPGSAAPALPPVDVDVASADELVPLPRIGPAAAARIVANRDSFGPFRSLEGLGRVRGMGAATLRQLAGRVTFSGRAASTSARRDYH